MVNRKKTSLGKINYELTSNTRKLNNTNIYLSIFGCRPPNAASISAPSNTVCTVFSAYILTRILVVDRDDVDLVIVGRRDEGGVTSCFGEPSLSSLRRRGKVPYLSAAIRVALVSMTFDSLGPFVVGHRFSSLGEFGVLHRAAEVFVGLARRAGLSLTRLGRSPVGRMRGLGVRGLGFSGGTGFSRLRALSRVARLGPLGAVTGRGVDALKGVFFCGSANVTLTRRRGLGGAPATEELSEPQPEPQDTTLEAQDREPPPLLNARPHPSTPLSLPAAANASSSTAGRLSRSSDRASSFTSQVSGSTLVSGFPSVFFSLVSNTTPLSFSQAVVGASFSVFASSVLGSSTSSVTNGGSSTGSLPTPMDTLPSSSMAGCSVTCSGNKDKET